MNDALDDLERRVTEKWLTAATARDGWESAEFDMSAWADITKVPLPANALETSTVGQPLPPQLQFPREQWASYPTKRTVVLLIADRMLDFGELTDEQWSDLCLLIHYGGKTRIA